MDRFADSFSIAGEKQEKAADEATYYCWNCFRNNPNVERARGQNSSRRRPAVEAKLHHDFHGVDFTER
jgi:hypothetical protein